MTNCLFNYTPDWSLTIDEQLFPLKNRCPFIVYMPNKPNKFGMKFWMLAEVDSKYVNNILPYLGALEREQRHGRPLAEDVIMRLTQSIHNQGGYNVTTDNFFTSVYLATLLLEKKISMVGTVRSNSKGLTKFMIKNDNELHKSSYFFNDGKEIVFVNYQYKKKKSVNLISTMHNGPSIDQSKKKKTCVIYFYNKNKVGVDVVDQMLRQYSTHTTNRRWPFAVWTNMLDIAASNSWVIYKKVTGEKSVGVILS